MRNQLTNIFPFLNWIPKTNKASIKSDLLAGLTNSVIVLPQGVAFALIAGLPPIYGIYTALITPIIAALFGSSNHLISGPTTAISIVMFSSISQFAEPQTPMFIQLAIGLTLMAGIIQFLFGIFKLGSIVNFVSHSVIVGFTAGAAVLIVTSQLTHLSGMEMAEGLNFIQKWVSILNLREQWNLKAIIIALATVISSIGLKGVSSKAPHMLFGLIVGSVLGYIWSDPKIGLHFVGDLNFKLPPLSLPSLSWEQIKMLSPNAFAIAILGLIEAVAIARSIGLQSHQKIDGNQEFIGQGLSNIVGSLFSSYAGSGSFTRSGVNYQAGGKTPMAAIFASIGLLILVILLGNFVSYIPMASMGGIILLVAINLIDFKEIKVIFTKSRIESVILTITFLATLVFHLEYAIYLGIIISVLYYLKKTSDPVINEITIEKDLTSRRFRKIPTVEKNSCPQLKVLKVEGPVFFGGLEHLDVFLSKYHALKVNVLIDCSSLTYIDMEGVQLILKQKLLFEQQELNIHLCSISRRLNGRFTKLGLYESFDKSYIHKQKEDAISKIYPLLNPNICRDCEVKIFLECQSNDSI